MTTNELLVEVAGYSRLPPLPWSNLKADGQGLMQSDVYLSFLRQRHISFTDVIRTLDISQEEWEQTQAEDLTDAWSDAYDRVARFAEEYARAGAIGQTEVAAQFALQLFDETVVRLIVLVDEVCLRNLIAHENGLPRVAVSDGTMTEADAEASASRIYQLWDAVITIDAHGYLSRLKRKGGGTQGFGLGAALPPAAIVTIVLIVIAAIVFIIVYGRQQAIEDARWRDVCLDKAGNARVPLPKGCEQGMPSGIAADLAKLFEGIGKGAGGESVGKGIAVAIVAAALLYVGGVYVLPSLMRRRAAA